MLSGYQGIIIHHGKENLEHFGKSRKTQMLKEKLPKDLPKNDETIFKMLNDDLRMMNIT